MRLTPGGVGREKNFPQTERARSPPRRERLGDAEHNRGRADAARESRRKIKEQEADAEADAEENAAARVR